MRKTALSVLAVLLVCGCAWGDRIPDFSAFPTWGICTGDYVRMREDADTKAAVLEPHRLHRDQRVIVLDETLTHGDTWYEIDHPSEIGTAWVFGKYIQAAREEEYQEDPMRHRVSHAERQVSVLRVGYNRKNWQIILRRNVP